MYYKHPTGRKLDLSSDAPPKINKILQRIVDICAAILAIIAIIGIVASGIDGALLISIAIIVGCIAYSLFFRWILKMEEKKYFKLRNEVLEQIAKGEIKVVDEATYKGVIFRGVEIGTNLMGWKRGIDRSNDLSPVSVKFSFTNKTGKEIKYLNVAVRPYNAVGDIVECQTTNVSLFTGESTGPFQCGKTYTQIINNAWYNTSIESVKIESAEIIYMDNTSEKIETNDIVVMPKQNSLSDNDNRDATKAMGTLLMIISGILDVISIFLISSLGSAFSIVTAISTIAFFIGLKMRY